MQMLKRFGIDGYILLLLSMVVAGAVIPAHGTGAVALGQITFWAVAVLFFLYGARLDLSSVRAGLMNLRLQGLCFGTTYGLFPVLGLGVAWAARPVLGDELALGVLFLAVLPSTVQSSIAFTGMARGNVAAAICAASVSNLAAVVLTPALMALILHQSGGISTDAVAKIAIQILIPFILGQLARPWVAGVLRHKQVIMVVDRGAILLIVYTAFSAGTVAGVWTTIPPLRLAALVAVIGLYMAAIMVLVRAGGRAAGLAVPDRAALFYCGSTKSLASGLPLATAMFSPETVGTIVLPLMLFHLGQLLVCAFIAQRQAQVPSARRSSMGV